MKINNTAAKPIKKYCYIVGLLSFLIAFFACSQMLRYQEKEKKASGIYMAQSTISRFEQRTKTPVRSHIDSLQVFSLFHTINKSGNKA